MSEARYITRAGFRTLEKEHERLWKIDRPKIVEEVAVAAAHGDRSENAEYKYGKRKLREIDRRIRFVSRLLDRLTIVEPDPSQEGRVFFGARVTVEDDAGEVRTYRIVGPDETDTARGEISVESPVARALLRKQVDDDVIVRTPRGESEFTIVAIAYDLPGAVSE